MQNFWTISNWEKQDKHLIGLENNPFRRPFPPINLKPGIFTIRGPRQIGKSSFLKTLLSEACQSHSSENVHFESCEKIASTKELFELLQVYKNKKFIFLDEVTFVENWSHPVKYLIDSGFKGTLVVTGSNLMDIRKGVDRMPGREGSGEDLQLLPMDFFEYKKMRMQAKWKDLDSLDELKNYLRIGGFPIAAIEAGAKSIKVTKSLRTIEKWILGDIIKAGKNEHYAKDLLSQIALTMGSQMSLQKLSQRTQIGSHHTVLDYINMFEDMFVVRSLYSVDPNTGSFRFKKEKKFYITDPLIFRLALNWIGLDIDDVEESVIAEMVAHEFLRRRHEYMGFLNSASGGEVDFYKFRKWAIEVKWSFDVKNLSKTYKELTVPYKKVWSINNFLEEAP